MKIEVTRQNGKVTVSVTVPHYNDFGCKEKIRINTTDVMAALTTAQRKGQLITREELPRCGFLRILLLAVKKPHPLQKNIKKHLTILQKML